jgi:thioredoxin 1
MAYTPTYAVDAPDRAEIDALPGPVLLEFGTGWCGHCQGAQPSIEAALRAYPELRFLKIEDGPGRSLGRSFRVKLWPTLIALKDGQEIGRVVRPAGETEINEALAGLSRA